MILRNFIVLEGIDGAGTSTQLDILKNTAGTEKFLFTAEPSPSPVGKFLRTMLKGDVPVSNETAAYIFAADRNEHVNGKMLVDGDRHLVTGISDFIASTINKYSGVIPYSTAILFRRRMLNPDAIIALSTSVNKLT